MRISVNIIYKIFSVLFILSLLSPYIRIPFLMKYDYLIVLLSSPLMLLKFLLSSRFDKVYTNSFILLAIFIVISFVSNNLGLALMENYSFYFPRETIQVFNRLYIFTFFYYIVKNQILNFEWLSKLFGYVSIIALIIGFIQVFNMEKLNNIFNALYASTESQVKFLNNSWNIRVFGTIGHPIKWGGMSLLFFWFFVLIYKHKFKYLGICLAILNILLTKSKASILAFVVTLIVAAVYYVIQKKLLKNKYFIGVLALIVLFIILLITGQFDGIIYRFSVLFEKIGSNELGRQGQLAKMLELLDQNVLFWIFGIGKANFDTYQRLMEIELLYIFGVYGIIGLLYYVFFHVYFIRSFINYDIDVERYFVYIVFIGYFIFSIGYYFFREINGGYQLWMLLGMLYGNLKLKANNNKIW